MLFGGPFLENGGELMVGNDDVFGDIGNPVDIIEHAAQYGAFTNLEQRFGEVFGEFSQTGGVTCGKNDCFHIFNDNVNLNANNF